MDRAVLYMKLYTFGMPFMNCTIAEIISFKIILKNSRTNLKRNICPGIFYLNFI